MQHVSHFVIASETKQSRATHEELDCFVASLLAMTACGCHFFTSGQRDNSSDWNASLPGIVASSL